MTTDDLDSGLLGIALSDSEDEPQECSKPAAPTSREERNAQSEEDFQKLKETYRVKVENGEVCSHQLQLTAPLTSLAHPTPHPS
jgi:hypothetical protein